MNYEQIVFLTYIIFTIFMMFITILSYAKDKSLAKEGKERIKEKTLLALAVFGGGLGALIGRIISKHKTNKFYFSLVIWLSVLFQVACLIVLGYLAFV